MYWLYRQSDAIINWIIALLIGLLSGFLLGGWLTGSPVEPMSHTVIYRLGQENVVLVARIASVQDRHLSSCNTGFYVGDKYENAEIFICWYEEK